MSVSRASLGRISAGLFVVASLALAVPALAGDRVELRDGRTFDAEHVDLRGDELVLHVARGKDGAKKQIRVKVADVEVRSALNALSHSISDGDGVAWLEYAETARRAGLFDAAADGYAKAAVHSESAQAKLDAFTAARPAEEARHLFDRACTLFRDGKREAAAGAAKSAVDANPGGPDALMASELLDLLSGDAPPVAAPQGLVPAAAPAPAIDARTARALRRLRKSYEREGTRLRRAQQGELGSYPTAVRSVSRSLGEVAEKLYALRDGELGAAAREETERLLASVEERRVSSLLLLADLGVSTGRERTALSAVHEVLTIQPDQALALDLRERLLEGVGDDTARGRNLLYRGSRILYHPYPYPARDKRSGLGLQPTWSSIRGLGKVPYSRPWDLDRDDGNVVIRRRPR